MHVCIVCMHMFICIYTYTYTQLHMKSGPFSRYTYNWQLYYKEFKQVHAYTHNILTHMYRCTRACTPKLNNYTGM